MVLSLDTLPAYSPLHSSHTLPLHTSLLSSTSSAPTKHLTTTTFLKFSNSNTSPTEDNPLLHESKLSPLLTDNDKTSNYQPPSHTPLPSHFWLLLAPPTYWLNLILHLNRNNCPTLGPASFNTSSPPKDPEDITNISVMTCSLKPCTPSDKPPLPWNPPPQCFVELPQHSAPTPANSGAFSANSNGPLANSNIFPAAASASPGLLVPLGPLSHRA
ncbi:hypothetical protein E4T56_gene1376 [Termitomyces sp. T112]|nr:hypothetical protein E4T56_gene1376 [Termitomyces sp. T112]